MPPPPLHVGMTTIYDQLAFNIFWKTTMTTPVERRRRRRRKQRQPSPEMIFVFIFHCGCDQKINFLSPYCEIFLFLAMNVVEFVLQWERFEVNLQIAVQENLKT